MRLYEAQCHACQQMAVLHGVCRMCGQIYSKPVHPLRNEHPVTGDDDDAPACDPIQTPDDTQTDDRGDAADDIDVRPDFDLGTGG